jgi:hypothetical protein
MMKGSVELSVFRSALRGLRTLGTRPRYLMHIVCVHAPPVHERDKMEVSFHYGLQGVEIADYV